MIVRRFLFRILVGIILLVSPAVLPGVFLLLRMRPTPANVREFYRDFWGMFVRGFA